MSKYAVSVFTESCKGLSAEQTFALLEDLGVTQIELGAGGATDTSHLSPSTLLRPGAAMGQFRDLLASHGLSVSALVLATNPIHPDKARAAADHQAFADTCRLASALGTDTLVLVYRMAREGENFLLPVDSEHSAIFQCLEGQRKNYSKILLTCGGGPFRTASAEQLKRVSWKDAMNHPTWNMGEKVTLDSATLMNKALEMVEAHHLFAAPEEKIEVLIHPQSIVHSMVEFEDGAVIAQLSMPDMRFPVQYAFTRPERCFGGLPVLDLARTGTLTFEKPDTGRFPSLLFAAEAIRRGGTAGAVMNAANEIAYRRFKAGAIGFTGIWKIVEQTMNAIDNGRKNVSPEEIMEADRAARDFASRIQLKG